MKEVYSNLTKGELAPELRGRIDTPQYKAGVALAYNFVIQKYGGMSFRPGFRFVAEADDVETPMRYIPFDFGLDQSYIIAAQDLGFRLLALGGIVTETNLEILAVSIAAQAVLTVSYHDVAVGDRFFLNGVTGMAELNGMFGTVVAVVDANNIRTDIDTRGFAAFTASDGTDRVAPPPSPPPSPPPPPPPPPPPSDPPVGGGGGSGGGWGGQIQ